MKKLIALLFSVFVATHTSCKTDTTGADDGGETADLPDEVGEVGDDESADTGGQTCDDSWAVYMCQGTVYGIHKRANNPSTEREFTTPTRDYVKCLSAEAEDLPIIVPMQMANDTQFLIDRCDAACQEEYSDYGWPAEPNGSAWEFVSTRCVVANQPNGYVTGLDAIPDNLIPNGVEGIYHPSDCDFYDDEVMIPLERSATDEDCMAASCGDWDPNGNITTSTNSTTRVITTSMRQSYLAGIYGPNWEDLYQCDDSRFEQAFPGGVETWKMATIVSGDFLYRVGFRTGDKELKMKCGSSGTWQSLDTGAHLVSALTTLQSCTTPWVEFKRQNHSGTWETWTLKGTLN